MLLLLLTSLMIKFNFQGISLLHDLLPQLIELGKLSGDACRKTMSQDDLHNLQLPSPWTLGKTVESVHPVFEQYKFEETITFPGAKDLFLKFDEKCSTQYNYDKVCDVRSTVCVSSNSLVDPMYSLHGCVCSAGCVRWQDHGCYDCPHLLGEQAWIWECQWELAKGLCES